jgi:Zn-finger nucleic acid-binding protein
MFMGSQFCGHCGAKAVTPQTDEKPAGDCPRCRRGLDVLAIGETVLRECQRCGGLWSDVETFESICSDRERQSAVLSFGGKRERTAAPPIKISYVPCPDCKQLMNRSNFARASGVIIDVCKKHGVWFDAEELPRIIGFIRGGGMELARQRERIELENERERLREERRRTGSQAESLDIAAYGVGGESSVTKTFLRALFE